MTDKPAAAAVAAPLVELDGLGTIRLDLNAMAAIEDVLGCGLAEWGQRLSEPTKVRLGELRNVLAAGLQATDAKSWGTLDDAKKTVGTRLHLGNVKQVAQDFSQAISEAMGADDDAADPEDEDSPTAG